MGAVKRLDRFLSRTSIKSHRTNTPRATGPDARGRIGVIGSRKKVLVHEISPSRSQKQHCARICGNVCRNAAFPCIGTLRESKRFCRRGYQADRLRKSPALRQKRTPRLANRAWPKLRVLRLNFLPDAAFFFPVVKRFAVNLVNGGFRYLYVARFSAHEIINVIDVA